MKTNECSKSFKEFFEENSTVNEADAYSRSQVVSLDKSIENDVDAKKFKRAYSGQVKSGHTDFDSVGIEGVTGPESKAGFAGSGTSYFVYNGKKYKVIKGANGKGFWGTSHTIYPAS